MRVLILTFLIIIVGALSGCATFQAYDPTAECDYRDPLCDSHNGYLASGGKHQG